MDVISGKYKLFVAPPLASDESELEWNVITEVKRRYLAFRLCEPEEGIQYLYD